MGDGGDWNNQNDVSDGVIIDKYTTTFKYYVRTTRGDERTYFDYQVRVPIHGGSRPSWSPSDKCTASTGRNDELQASLSWSPSDTCTASTARNDELQASLSKGEYERYMNTNEACGRRRLPLYDSASYEGKEPSLLKQYLHGERCKHTKGKWLTYGVCDECAAGNDEGEPVATSRSNGDGRYCDDCGSTMAFCKHWGELYKGTYCDDCGSTWDFCEHGMQYYEDSRRRLAQKDTCTGNNAADKLHRRQLAALK